MPDSPQYLHRSWMLVADDAIRLLVDDDTSEETVLTDTLEACLSDAEWHARPDETDLYPFLARCWPYPALRLLIQAAMQFWPKERRVTLEQCLQPYVPSADNGRQPPSPSVSSDPGQFDLQYTKENVVRETLYNYMQIFTYHPYWGGKLHFDTFANSVAYAGHGLKDADIARIGHWFGEHYRFAGNQRQVRRDAITAIAEVNAYDPLQQYIATLPAWDDTPRLDTWLAVYCGAEADARNAWIGTMLLVQMIARAVDPGCMARYVVIFEGAEDTGKSACVRLLGAPWANTFDMSLDSKEAHMAMQGLWVAELSELDSLNRSQETRIKSFLTQTHDSFIPKYANYPVTYARRTVFVGTTNENRYLIGQTGNTRFLPVETGVFDLGGLVAQREQLLAEASHVYQNTLQWWQAPQALTLTLQEARDDRKKTNVYEEALAEWLTGHVQHDDVTRILFTSWEEIAEDFLSLPSKAHWEKTSLQMQIALALRGLGYTNTRRRIKGDRRHWWWKWDDSRDSQDSQDATPF